MATAARDLLFADKPGGTVLVKYGSPTGQLSVASVYATVQGRV